MYGWSQLDSTYDAKNVCTLQLAWLYGVHKTAHNKPSLYKLVTCIDCIPTLDLCRTSDKSDRRILRCHRGWNATTVVRRRCPRHAAASDWSVLQTAPWTRRSACPGFRRTEARSCTYPTDWAARECARPSRRSVAPARRSWRLAGGPAPPAFPCCSRSRPTRQSTNCAEAASDSRGVWTSELSVAAARAADYARTVHVSRLTAERSPTFLLGGPVHWMPALALSCTHNQPAYTRLRLPRSNAAELCRLFVLYRIPDSVKLFSLSVTGPVHSQSQAFRLGHCYTVRQTACLAYLRLTCCCYISLHGRDTEHNAWPRYTR